jgi:hypothetical protein
MIQRVAVTLSVEERELLERWARRPKSAQALAPPCRTVLEAIDGESSKDIAATPMRSQVAGTLRPA